MARTRKSDKENTVSTDTDTTAPAFDPRAMSATEIDMDFKTTSTRDKYADNPFTADVRKSFDAGRPLAIEVPHSNVAEMVGWLRDAAIKAELGLSLRYRVAIVKEDGSDGYAVFGTVKELPADETDYPVHVAFQGKEKKKTTASDRITCPECGTEKTIKADGKIRAHKRGDGQCPGSGLQTTTETDDE